MAALAQAIPGFLPVPTKHTPAVRVGAGTHLELELCPYDPTRIPDIELRVYTSYGHQYNLKVTVTDHCDIHVFHKQDGTSVWVFAPSHTKLWELCKCRDIEIDALIDRKFTRSINVTLAER